MTTAEAMPVKRGCGTRVAGGIYAECGLGPDGMPLEHFLIDPPVPIDPPSLGLAPQGVTLVKMNGPKPTVNLLDWVGSCHYPNVADFLEEVRRFGLSRRIQRNADFSALNARSTILLAHSSAIVHEPGPWFSGWYEQRDDSVWPCPKELVEHREAAEQWTMAGRGPDLCCAGIWWQDLMDGESTDNEDAEREVIRCLPSFSYIGLRPPRVSRTHRSIGLFARFPITRLVVVADTEGGTHEDALIRAQAADLPVVMVPE